VPLLIRRRTAHASGAAGLRALGIAAALATIATPIRAGTPPLVDVRQRVESGSGRSPEVVLTLDACGGGYDVELIETLVRLRVPATIFVTRIWLERHPQAVRQLLSHPALFELQNHGAAHRPAVIGRSVYRMPGAATAAEVESEVALGAQAVARATGTAPRWYRGAGALYDTQSLTVIGRLGQQVAGYSVNADDGATATVDTVTRRLRDLRPGDIVLAHVNRPAGATAEGFAAALPQLLQRGLHFARLSEVSVVTATAAPAAIRHKTPVRGRRS
jgi:peptidoglycan/xylan/chitin deacetylase (PgdA/CDA1 family)